MSIDIPTALSLAEQIVMALIKLAPAIEQGVISEVPYVQAIAGLITGSNATMDSINVLLAQLEADSATFQSALPPEVPGGPTDV
jgi:hypothetical protein